jgi:hypothetical protein
VVLGKERKEGVVLMSGWIRYTAIIGAALGNCLHEFFE